MLRHWTRLGGATATTVGFPGRAALATVRLERAASGGAPCRAAQGTAATRIHACVTQVSQAGRYATLADEVPQNGIKSQLQS